MERTPRPVNLGGFTRFDDASGSCRAAGRGGAHRISRVRTIGGHVRHSSRRSGARWNCARASHRRKAARQARLTPATSRRSEIRKRMSPDTQSRLTSTSWHSGRRGQRYADAPSRKGCHEAPWQNSHPMSRSLPRSRPRRRSVAHFSAGGLVDLIRRKHVAHDVARLPEASL
jgi:hypothetical protein